MIFVCAITFPEQTWRENVFIAKHSISSLRYSIKGNAFKRPHISFSTLHFSDNIFQCPCVRHMWLEFGRVLLQHNQIIIKSLCFLPICPRFLNCFLNMVGGWMPHRCHLHTSMKTLGLFFPEVLLTKA